MNRDELTAKILRFLNSLHKDNDASYIDIIYAGSAAMRNLLHTVLDTANKNTEAKQLNIDYLNKEVHTDVARKISKAFADDINKGNIIEFELIYIFFGIATALFNRIDDFNKVMNSNTSSKDKNNETVFEIKLEDDEEPSHLDKIIEKFKNL